MKLHRVMLATGTVVGALTLAAISGCGSDTEQDNGAAPPASASTADLPAAATTPFPVLEERYLTERDESANVDSVATWHGPDSQHWLIATAKEGNVLQVFDAGTGKVIQRVGDTGDGPGEFSRPNSVSVVDDLAVVVERDNRRVQVLQLPSFEPLGSFGEDKLRKPYGLWLHKLADGGYRIYITDSYETSDEQIPPPEELDARVQQYRFAINNGSLQATHERAFGDTRGDGVLNKVESLFGDAVTGRLLIADELEAEANIKVYDFGGRFSGTVFGNDVFDYEPEGIALYACEDGSGYWLIADQDDDVNRFHVFRRDDLQLVGSFGGETTRNTDGIWLTTMPMPGFANGAFFAVHDDGNVAAFDFREILDALSLEPCTRS